MYIYRCAHIAVLPIVLPIGIAYCIAYCIANCISYCATPEAQPADFLGSTTRRLFMAPPAREQAIGAIRWAE